MKKVLLLFLIAFTACQTKNEIKYQISHEIKNGKPSLHVSMELKANSSGETVLVLQDKAWGQEELYNTLKNLQSDQTSEIIREKDSNRIVLKHPKDLQTIQFSYDIQQDTEGNLTTRDTYRPIIQKEYFHVFSHNLFMLPRDYIPSSTTPFDVTIQWKGFDKDVNLINSFDTNNRNQRIENTNERFFHSAIFTGGDYRLNSINIKENEAIFGIRGNWKVFNDSTMVNVLKKTLHAQRDFWQDHSQKYFAVTMTPTFLEIGSSFQGSGLTNSFATSASNNEYLEPEGLIYLFNHELQHNWIGRTIKNENEESQYWFSEGFTDYYTIKNIAKNHIYDLDESYFIKEFNQFIKALYNSPVKEAPNSEINYKNFWSNRDYSKLPYRRGAIFAFYLDYKIKQDSDGKKTLDDLMLAIKDDAINNEQKLNHSYFIKKANEFLKDDLKPFFDEHIEHGKLYDLASIFQEFDYEYNSTNEVFDLGFTFTEDGKSIAEIDEQSNAYLAGLRKGDRITSRSYYYDNPTKQAKFKVKRGSKEATYMYFPAKEAEIPSLKNNEHNKKVLSF